MWGIGYTTILLHFKEILVDVSSLNKQLDIFYKAENELDPKSPGSGEYPTGKSVWSHPNYLLLE